MFVAVTVAILVFIAVFWVTFPYCLGSVKRRILKIPRSTGARIIVCEDVVVLLSRSHPDNEIRVSESFSGCLGLSKITFRAPGKVISFWGFSLWECNWKFRSRIGDQWYQIPADIRKTYDLIYPRSAASL